MSRPRGIRPDGRFAPRTYPNAAPVEPDRAAVSRFKQTELRHIEDIKTDTR